MKNRKHQATFTRKILLLGSGELGKELTISLKRLGQTVIAVDRYADAPAMQVADGFEVINMLDEKALRKVVLKHQPDLIVPEVEAIRTTELLKLESEGFRVIPTAEAAHLTMNRDAIRDVAARELKLRTAKFAYANSAAELVKCADRIGYPLVIKPVMSSSGKGQSVVTSPVKLNEAWEFACENMRGDQKRVIAEEFIRFDFEITLLTIRTQKKVKKGTSARAKNAKTYFCEPIGHRQERGDYQESWMPAAMTAKQIKLAQAMAKKVTDRLGGVGLFGVEFFVCGNDVIFSELSPRPHDTGMVTLISQNVSEFDLHARAILGLPIPKIETFGPSASAVILAASEASSVEVVGVEAALGVAANSRASKEFVDVRIFGKRTSRPYRRMGVALARSKSVTAARRLAKCSAACVRTK